MYQLNCTICKYTKITLYYEVHGWFMVHGYKGTILCIHVQPGNGGGDSSLCPASVVQWHKPAKLGATGAAHKEHLCSVPSVTPRRPLNAYSIDRMSMGHQMQGQQPCSSFLLPVPHQISCGLTIPAVQGQMQAQQRTLMERSAFLLRGFPPHSLVLHTRGPMSWWISHSAEHCKTVKKDFDLLTSPWCYHRNTSLSVPTSITSCLYVLSSNYLVKTSPDCPPWTVFYLCRTE